MTKKQGTYGPLVGTITSKATPSSVAKGQPVRLSVETRWTETDQRTPCPYTPGSGRVGSHTGVGIPILRITPGRPLEPSPRDVIEMPGTGTRTEDNTTACGPPNTSTWVDRSEAVVPGATTAGLEPGCYAPYPVGFDLGWDTMSGTLATFSVGGVSCTAAAASAGATTTDTFTAAGQVRPHAVVVPANRTRAEITLRWAKPSDRFTIAGIALAPKRKTSSVSRAEKLKITFAARSGTSLTVRVTGLSAGRLSYRVVATKVKGKATVKTTTVLRA